MAYKRTPTTMAQKKVSTPRAGAGAKSINVGTGSRGTMKVAKSPMTAKRTKTPR